MSAEDRNSEVDMSQVFYALRDYASKGSADSEDNLSKLFDRLCSDPRRPEWEKLEQDIAHKATLARQTEQDQLRERQDD